jgi:AraC-like DNA-binding protein
MIIPTSVCLEFLSAIEKQRAINPFVRDRKATSKIMEYYAELKSDQNNKIKTIGYTNVILGIIMENVGFEAAVADMNPHLSSRILMYINENYKEDITLTSIATSLGYNPSYLSRYFKSCFHIGINQYITLVRLKQFVILSNDSEKSVANCAYESGFRSLRTFYRAFYNEFKCSPKDFIS